MAKLSILAPTPLAKPDIPTIETPQNIPPLPLYSEHGGRKRSFRIDAKLFSLLTGGGLIHMLFMRHVGMLRALFGLVIGVLSDPFLSR